MRYIICFVGFVLVSCTQAKKEPVANLQEVSEILSQLKGEWQMLTEWGDGQVIFHPCDADNMMLRVYSDTLMVSWGQDASITLIKSFYTEEDGKIVITVQDLDNLELMTYYFQYEDESKKIARWWLYGMEDGDELFVHRDIAESYSSYEQPCHECWDDCGEN